MNELVAHKKSNRKGPSKLNLWLLLHNVPIKNYCNLLKFHVAKEKHKNKLELKLDDRTFASDRNIDNIKTEHIQIYGFSYPEICSFRLIYQT